jgi:hypothetical protein
VEGINEGKSGFYEKCNEYLVAYEEGNFFTRYSKRPYFMELVILLAK